MTEALAVKERAPAPVTLDIETLTQIALVRVACAGTQGLTRAILRRDLAPIVAHSLSAGELRERVDHVLMMLHRQGLVVPLKLRVVAAPAGIGAAHRFLGAKLTEKSDWTTVRDVMLVARALGLKPERGRKGAGLDSALGLRRAILERAFGVSAGKKLSSAALRDALAKNVAIPATKIDGVGQVAAFKDATTRRQAVAQLLRRPRAFATDGALVAELAAEQVGAVQTGASSLRLALLRKLIRQSVAKDGSAENKAKAAPDASRNSSSEIASGRLANPVSVSKPGLLVFSKAVLKVAAACAQGWPGSRRAYISHVWQGLDATRRGWSLTEAEYKIMLADAHQSGLLTLAYSDLRDDRTIADVQASVTRYGNAEWHFIRVDG